MLLIATQKQRRVSTYRTQFIRSVLCLTAATRFASEVGQLDDAFNRNVLCLTVATQECVAVWSQAYLVQPNCALPDRCDPDIVVLDEAQRIKFNRNVLCLTIATRLRPDLRHRLNTQGTTTATPI